MKRILFLFFALLSFVIVSAQITTGDFNKVRAISVLEIPKYNSLANATLAGSKVGNLVRIYTGLEKGVYIRDSTAWVKLGNSIDSIKAKHDTLFTYLGGVEMFAGILPSTGAISQSSNSTGITTVVGSVSSSPHKIAPSALSGKPPTDPILLSSIDW